MCNLHSITRSQEAMRRALRVMRDLTGNLPSLPAVFPDRVAPVVRTARDGRELTMMRCDERSQSEIALLARMAQGRLALLSACRVLWHLRQTRDAATRARSLLPAALPPESRRRWRHRAPGGQIFHAWRG